MPRRLRAARHAAGLGPCARLWSHMRGRARIRDRMAGRASPGPSRLQTGQTPAHARARVEFLARDRTGFSLFRASLTL